MDDPDVRRSYPRLRRGDLWRHAQLRLYVGNLDEDILRSPDASKVNCGSWVIERRSGEVEAIRLV